MRSRIIVRLLVIAAAPAFAQLPQGAIGTLVGTGSGGYSDGNGTATAAQLELAYDVAVDPWGNTIVADSWNHRIRRVTPAGTVSVLAGNGTAGFSGDGGIATAAVLNFPRALAVDSWGNIYFADSGNGVIRKLRTDGLIQTIAGNRQTGYAGDGGSALDASFRVPRGLAVDRVGNLYVADSFNARVRKIGIDGNISTVAGTGVFGDSGDGGPASAAELGFVQSITVDLLGVLYLSDSSNHKIRRVRTDGVIETVAGIGTGGYSGDNGPAKSAALNLPRAIAVDSTGTLYVADSANQRIRRIGPDGIIKTVVGVGIAGFTGDQGRADLASIRSPYGLAADGRGNLYIGDLLNYRVRKARIEYSSAKPSFKPQPVLNAASFTSAISPGSLISIFGQDFGYEQLTPAGLPLPPSMSGTSVLVNGKPIPMVFRAANQINAQLPWSGLSSPLKVRVSFGGVESDEISVPMVPAAPGAFTYGDNRAVAQNADGALNTASAPAELGSTIVLYATGLGGVSIPQIDGTGAPANPLAETTGATSATIGGVPARVVFSGLAPGFVGLWQINIEVPTTASVGNAIPLKIAVNGVQSNESAVSVK